jgi:hypothetical protein
MTAVWEPDPAGVYFSDEFTIEPDVLEAYGALDMSVVTDLPLFIDPFLLFKVSRKSTRASSPSMRAMSAGGFGSARGYRAARGYRDSPREWSSRAHRRGARTQPRARH